MTRATLKIVRPSAEPIPTTDALDPYAQRPDISADIRMGAQALLSLARKTNDGVSPGGTFTSLGLAIRTAKLIQKDLPGLIAAMEAAEGKRS